MTRITQVIREAIERVKPVTNDDLGRRNQLLRKEATDAERRAFLIEKEMSYRKRIRDANIRAQKATSGTSSALRLFIPIIIVAVILLFLIVKSC